MNDKETLVRVLNVVPNHAPQLLNDNIEFKILIEVSKPPSDSKPKISSFSL